MDNLCHTLVGAALAETGLKRRTALGSATLLLAVNFPDIDVFLAALLGHNNLGFRRGITHGFPALVVLPLVLTLIMLGWHRWRRRGAAPNARWLFVLSAIGMLTHPFLDWMNTYGMRWWMPLDGSWSYADTLFIVDPWIWLALGVGVWLARRRQRAGASGQGMAATVALALVAGYVIVMGALTVTSRAAVRGVLAGRSLTPDIVVVEPVPVNPLRRRVIYHWEGSYHVANYAVLSRDLSAPWFSIPLNATHPAVALANETAQGREYHSWARLPYYVIERSGGTTWVTIADARYTLNGESSWAATRIPVTSTAVAGRCASERNPDFGSSPCE
jgi:inner membrane protein